MSKVFTVLEHSNIFIGEERDFLKNTLSKKDRDYLENIEFENKKVFDFINSNTLRTSSIVGSISLKDGTIIEILPKILKNELDEVNLVEYRKNFIQMIKFSKSNPILGNANSSKIIRGELPLISYILELFTKSLLSKLQQGTFKDYSEKVESSDTIRGNIDIHQTRIKHQFDRSRVVVQYRKHSDNSLLMQIFKGVVVTLLKDRNLSYQTKRSSFEILSILNSVDNLELRERDFERVQFNRLNENYKELFQQAKIIYSRYMPFNAKINSTPFWSILFDMNKLFEDFVELILKKSDINFESQKSFEIYENVKIRPDIIIEEDDEVQIVIDTKYKIFNKKPNREDLYQLLSYKYSLGAKKGYFIVPTFEDRENLVFLPKINGNDFEVIFLNIGNGIEDILKNFKFKIDNKKLEFKASEKIKDFGFSLSEEEISIFYKSASKQHSLALASTYGYFNLVVHLILDGIDVNFQHDNMNNLSKGDWTPLMLATKYNHFEVVRLLLNNGANPNLQDQFGYTALIIAIYNQNIDILRLLLNNGADPNITMEFGGGSAIFFTANVNILKILIRFGANIELKNMLDQTPLESALFNNEKEKIESLLSVGAKLYDNFSVDETILKNQKLPLEKRFLIFVQNGNIDEVKKLLTIGVDINYRENQDDFSALMLASQKGDINMVEILLKYGSDVNMQDEKGWTALLIAVYKQHIDIIKLLMKARLSPFLRVSGGGTLFIIGIQTENKEIQNIIKKYIQSWKKYSFLEIAEIVLTKEKRLLSPLEIMNKGKYLYSGSAYSFEDTLRTYLGKSVLKNENIFYREKINNKFHYGLLKYKKT